MTYFTLKGDSSDCFKYRHKIGLDVAIEALRDCWQSRTCEIDELWNYALLLKH